MKIQRDVHVCREAPCGHTSIRSLAACHLWLVASKVGVSITILINRKDREPFGQQSWLRVLRSLELKAALGELCLLESLDTNYARGQTLGFPRARRCLPELGLGGGTRRQAGGALRPPQAVSGWPWAAGGPRAPQRRAPAPLASHPHSAVSPGGGL